MHTGRLSDCRYLREPCVVYNDIARLHSRYMASIKQKDAEVETMRVDVRQKCEEWTALKRQYDSSMAAAAGASGDSTRSDSRVLYQRLREKLRDIRSCEKSINDHTQTDHATEYLLSAVPFLNKHHTLESERQVLLREMRSLRDCSAAAPPTTSTPCREAGADHTTANSMLKELDHKLRAIVDQLRQNADEYTARFFSGMKLSRQLQASGQGVCGRTQQKKFLPGSRVCTRCDGEVTETPDMSLVCVQCGCIVGQGMSDRNPRANLSWEDLKNAPSRSYTYLRINHFREYIRQVQGKSSRSPPESVIEEVRRDFEKTRTRVGTINAAKVRACLKRLKRGLYYDHIYSIARKLNPDFRCVDIDPLHEEKLCLMFVQLEEPFEWLKRSGKIKCKRKNFLSYPYVYFKLNELNGWDDYNRHTVLLKSPQLLNIQDRWWGMMVDRLGWQNVGRTLV